MKSMLWLLNFIAIALAVLQVLSSVLHASPDLVSQTRSGATHYYVYDGLSTVRYLTGTGDTYTTDVTISDTYTYDAFGIGLPQPPSAPPNLTPNHYRYTGEQWEPDLGLYYLRARYYNPAEGSFLTLDTFEGNQNDPLSLHKYIYSHADPVNRIDPSGNESLLSINATIGIIGFANRLELQGANASLQKARALFGADESVNSLINGVEIASIVDDTIGQVALGGAALYGGFKVVNALKSFVSSGTANRVGQAILRNLQRMVGSSPAACFTAGTVIKTEFGKVPIEHVQTGDYVWSWNEETETFALQRVTSTMERTSEAVIELQIDGDVITVTLEHPFQVTGRGWTAAKDLEIGESVASELGQPLLVESKAFRRVSVQVFNLEVENTHTYLVGPDGVVVHNACAWATRSGSLPSAPGIYIIKTPKGETYVGQALDLADRLKQVKHAHSDLIRDPANELYTIQVDMGQWKGSTVDAIDMAEEFYIRALGAKSGSSNPGGLNRRFEVNQADLERLTRQYGFPDLMAPTPH